MSPGLNGRINEANLTLRSVADEGFPRVVRK